MKRFDVGMVQESLVVVFIRPKPVLFYSGELDRNSATRTDRFLVTDLPPSDDHTMSIVEPFGGLDLEDGPALDKQIDEVNLLKAFETDLDRYFNPRAGAPISQFCLVDSLVEKSPKIAMDAERVPHYLKGNVTEVILRYLPQFGVDGYGHCSSDVLTEELRDRKIS